METLAAFVLAIVLLVKMLLRLKIYVSVAYKRQGADDLLSVDVSLMRKFVSYHMEVPVIRVFKQQGLPWTEARLATDGGELAPRVDREERYVKNISDIFLHHGAEWRQMIHELVDFSHWYQSLVRRLNHKLLCENLYWRTRLGMEDAATTGLGVGLFWLLKSEGLIYLKQRFPFSSSPILKVEPDYTSAGLEVDFRCIFSIRMGNLMNAALSLLNVPGKVVNDSG